MGPSNGAHEPRDRGNEKQEILDEGARAHIGARLSRRRGGLVRRQIVQRGEPHHARLLSELPLSRVVPFLDVFTQVRHFLL